MALAVMFGTAMAFAPIPRITWEHREVRLVQFHEPDIYNYSALLLSEYKDTLYIGAREAVFAVNALNISEKQHEVYWKVSEDKKSKMCRKGEIKTDRVPQLHPGAAAAQRHFPLRVWDQRIPAGL